MSDHVLGRRLQWATISWNSIEVFVTITLGLAARSLALIAFGLDSLIEVFASLVVLWHMGDTDDDPHTSRDMMAQRLLGLAFGLLATFLLVASARILWLGTEPDSSPLAIAYLSVTALVMFALARLKRRVGTRLGNEPFQAEASMTFLDGCLATGILAALVLNTTLGWWWADPLAAAVVGLAAATEAREGFSSDRADPTGVRQ